MSTTTDPNIITLKNVRLSFPHLFNAHAMEAGQEPKVSAVFLLQNKEHDALIKLIEKTAARVALDEFKKPIRLTRELLRDGNTKQELEGYGDGVTFLTASRKTRPVTVDRDTTPVAEEDGKLYAGCYVNATVRLWCQNNKWGKSVNAELRGVQFVKDGPSFGAGAVNAETEFEAVEGDPEL